MFAIWDGQKWHPEYRTKGFFTKDLADGWFAEICQSIAYANSMLEDVWWEVMPILRKATRRQMQQLSVSLIEKAKKGSSV